MAIAKCFRIVFIMTPFVNTYVEGTNCVEGFHRGCHTLDRGRRTVAGHGSSHRDDRDNRTRGDRCHRSTCRRSAAHVLPIACAAVVVLHTFVVSVDNASPAKYAMTSQVARSLDLATGVALMTAGAITAILRPRSSIAPVTASLGAVWLAPDWFGWVDGPSAARTLAMLLIPLAVPLLAHLVLAYPSGRIRRPRRDGVRRG